MGNLKLKIRLYLSYILGLNMIPDKRLMIEDAIRSAREYPTKAELLRHLPKKVMYQTFCVVIEYLLYSGKISVDAEGKVGWIYYPEKVKQDLKFKHLFWKKPRQTGS